MEMRLSTLINNKGENPLCVVSDDVDSIGSCFKLFCEKLRQQCPDLLLWATSSSENNVPGGWEVKTFTQTLNCPPAVAREASRAGANYVVSSPRNQAPCFLSPTDGPEVEYIHHKKGRALTIHNCTDCGRIVAQTLLQKFIIRKDISVPTDEETMSASKPFMSGEEESVTSKGSVLGFKDLLVLYEDRRQPLIDGLKSSGIPVGNLQAEGRNEVFDEENDFACVLHIDQLTTYRPRRKIVVYVEDKKSPRDPRKKWRGITSCTSQLIVMKWNP